MLDELGEMVEQRWCRGGRRLAEEMSEEDHERTDDGEEQYG